MERLPEELIAYIFDYVQTAHALSAAMVVNHRWYMYGARNLHSRLVLNLGIDLAIDSPNVVISLMKRLISPTLSTAHLIRHLDIFGIVNAEVQALIINVLRHATTLRSLNIHALNVCRDVSPFPTEVFSSMCRLPNLVALNIALVPRSLPSLHTSQLHALRVQEPVDHATLCRLTDLATGFSRSIRSLELAISVDGPGTAVEEMVFLASALAHAPLRALSVQFVLPHAGLMSWGDFEVCASICLVWDGRCSVTSQDAISQMGPALRGLFHLRVLSIVIRPDPIMTTINSAILGSGDSQRESQTRRLAERLIADHQLDLLTRLELRWHGWKVEDGQLVALPRSELLRLPQSWIYEQYGQCSGALR
ncbi:hypothetical protein ONZ51_g1089 [Trametes cubensis]|uniref:F-box domain-containing protein n=1 Tax=Trametes cubensis TaxID=1111947 RepID=A0AAD7U248_9APHY|nr:hypothetical protein ONZ51_g1089 [Trametes cubensis]